MDFLLRLGGYYMTWWSIFILCRNENDTANLRNTLLEFMSIIEFTRHILFLHFFDISFL